MQLVVVQGQWRDGSSVRHLMVSRVEQDGGVVQRELDILDWCSEIATSHGNTQRLWQTLQSVLGEPATDYTGAHTTDDFATFLRTRFILYVHPP